VALDRGAERGGELLIRELARGADRVFDRPRVAAAVADHHHAIEADQRRAARARIVDAVAQLQQRRLDQVPSELGAQRVRDLGLDHAHHGF
jgi:hypothetical protein